MVSKFEDDENFKALPNLDKASIEFLNRVTNPLITDEEIAQDFVDHLNAYADEIRFIQEQYHYLTGKRLEGFAYPEGRVKMSDIIFTRDENGEKK